MGVKIYASQDWVEEKVNNQSVSYTEIQSPTDAQKTQARNNIGAYGFSWHQVPITGYLANVYDDERNITDWDGAIALTVDHSDGNKYALLCYLDYFMRSACFNGYVSDDKLIEYITKYIIPNLDILISNGFLVRESNGRCRWYYMRTSDMFSMYDSERMGITYFPDRSQLSINNFTREVGIFYSNGEILANNTKPKYDTTFTFSDTPADAKAVGDALATKIAAPATATVGQVIVVKAVDDNGVPTEWEAADMVSGNFLPDVTSEDNDKIIQVVDGIWTAVNVADSAVATFVNNYINTALGGDY